MLTSFVKIVLWIMAITLPLIWLFPSDAALGPVWKLSIVAAVGGFVFGVGAMLNGGCAVSTLWKLGNGQLRMLATLAAFGAGAWCYAVLVRSATLAPPSRPRTLMPCLDPRRSRWSRGSACG